MKSFSDELLGNDTATTETIGSFSDALLGNYDQPKGGPIVKDPARDLTAGMMFKGGFASDQDEELRFYASKLYPDEPVDKAVKRIGVQDGVYYHVGKDGVKRKLTPSGITGFLEQQAGGVGKGIPVATGTIGGISSAPLATTGAGAAASLAIAGGAAGLGEAARQKVGDWMFNDEVQNKDGWYSIQPGPVVDETAMGAGGQALGFGMTSLANRMLAKDLPYLNQQEMQQTGRLARKFEIPVTPAESSNLSSLKAQQKRLSNTLPAANSMEKFYSERNDKVLSAWGKYLDSIAAGKDAEDVGYSARHVAQSALDDLKLKRSQAAQPFYDRAFMDETTVVDTSNIIADISQQMEMAPKTTLARVLGQVRETLAPDGVPQTGIEQLHYVKMEIDNMLENPRDNGIGRTLQRRLVEIKNELLDRMDEASPLYRQAREVYADRSNPVDEAAGTAILALSKVKDDRLRKATAGIFDQRNKSPKGIRNLKTYFEIHDPKAWNDIKRLYLLEKSEAALKYDQTGSINNAAGKLYVTFARKSVRENLKAAMTKKEAETFDDLMKVLKAASRVKPLGSDTAWNQQLQREANQSARPVFAKIMRNSNPAQFLRSSDEFMTNRRLTKRDTHLVNLITSGDPEVAATIRELRKLPPESIQARILIGHLSLRSLRFAAEGAVPNRDYPAQEDGGEASE